MKRFFKFVATKLSYLWGKKFSLQNPFSYFSFSRTRQIFLTLLQHCDFKCIKHGLATAIMSTENRPKLRRIPIGVFPLYPLKILNMIAVLNWPELLCYDAAASASWILFLRLLHLIYSYFIINNIDHRFAANQRHAQLSSRCVKSSSNKTYYR